MRRSTLRPPFLAGLFCGSIVALTIVALSPASTPHLEHQPTSVIAPAFLTSPPIAT